MVLALCAAIAGCYHEFRDPLSAYGDPLGEAGPPEAEPVLTDVWPEAQVQEAARLIRAVYGGEAVRAGGEVIGRLRSVAQGPVVGRTIGYVYVDGELAADPGLTVDVFDERVSATLAPDVSWDPAGERMRG